MAKLFSLTGVDGTGKTTLIDRISKKTFSQSVRTLRVPQYYESISDEFSETVELLENIGKWADVNKCATLKANATYLQFCLFGQVIEPLQNSCEIIISERHPIIDSLAFAKFYYHALKTEQNKIDLQTIFLKKFTTKQLEQVNGVTRYDLLSVHNRMLLILEQDFSALLENLTEDFNVKFPEKLVILSASEQLITKRLNESSKVKEAHEQVPVLVMMQNALINYSSLFKSSCEVLVEEVDEKGEAVLTQSILNFYNIF